MEPHTETDHSWRQLERWLTRGGDRAGKRGNTDRASIVARFCSHSLQLVKAASQCRGGAGQLHDRHKASNPPALVLLDRRRRRNVVPNQYRADLDAFLGGKFGCHVEVQHIAGVVSVEVEHTFAAVDGPSGLESDVWGRRGEDVAASGAVCQIFPDQAVVNGLMSGTTTDE